jgi:hypothetical protein
MGETCNLHGGHEKYLQNFNRKLWDEEIRLYESLEWSTVIKCVLERQDVGVWARLSDLQ